MLWEEREIQWTPLAASNFIHDFAPSLSDVEIINAKVAYVRDNPIVGARVRVNKENIPEFRDIEGDIYVSRAERWIVYHRWMPNYIEIIQVDNGAGTQE